MSHMTKHINFKMCNTYVSYLAKTQYVNLTFIILKHNCDR